MSSYQKPSGLDFAGLIVNKAGRLVSQLDHPTVDEHWDKDQQRSHRVKFTDGDDIALDTWLAKAAAEGISVKGSRFWDALEQTNPRHTSASWQGHWRSSYYRQRTVDLNADARKRQEFIAQIERNNVIPFALVDVDEPKSSRWAASTSSDAASNSSIPDLTAQASMKPSFPLLTTSSRTEAPPKAVPAKKPNDCDEALRRMLGLQGEKELCRWLSQGWVIDAYEEYYQVAIHQWRLAMEAIESRSGNIPEAERRSTEKFLVSRSANALRSRNRRYIDLNTDKSYWSKDDHDIRFIVRLVDAGRCSGRYWERHINGSDIEYLCRIAHRLMCWYRAMARIVNANNGMGRWRRARAQKWHRFLCEIRCQRAAEKSH